VSLRNLAALIPVGIKNANQFGFLDMLVPPGMMRTQMPNPDYCRSYFFHINFRSICQPRQNDMQKALTDQPAF
jgi:hypothetical protein